MFLARKTHSAGAEVNRVATDDLGTHARTHEESCDARTSNCTDDPPPLHYDQPPLDFALQQPPSVSPTHSLTELATESVQLLTTSYYGNFNRAYLENAFELFRRRFQGFASRGDIVEPVQQRGWQMDACAVG